MVFYSSCPLVFTHRASWGLCTRADGHSIHPPLTLSSFRQPAFRPKKTLFRELGLASMIKFKDGKFDIVREALTGYSSAIFEV